METILITGGAGFVGSALAYALTRRPDTRIVVVDNLSTGSLINLRGGNSRKIHFVESDVNQYEEIAHVFEEWKPTFVFHYAAVVGVQRTLASPVSVLNDVNGIRHILDLSVSHRVQRVFYSSSSEVYGEPVHIPQHEHNTPLNSRLPYAVVKNVGEAYLRSYHTEYGLNYTIFRFFNTYGAGQSGDFVIPRFIKAALAGEPLLINGDGSQTRTFCGIADNVDATLVALNQNLFINDVVNIGSDSEVTIKALAELIVNLTQSSSPIHFQPPLEEGDMTRRKPDIGKMKQLLQREPEALREGLINVIEYYRKCVESTAL